MYYYKDKIDALIESENKISKRMVAKNNWVEISKEEFNKLRKKKIWHLTDEEYYKLNPPQETMEITTKRGKEYVRLIDDEKWLYIGYVHNPKTRFDIFIHHLCHGILMRYPLHKVLLYAIFNNDVC